MIMSIITITQGWLIDWAARGPPLPPRCSVPPHASTTGEVYSLQVASPDGIDERCFATRYTIGAKAPMPVLLYHHGATGSAADCGADQSVSGEALGEAVSRHGFALVCTEALQYSNSSWPVPGMSGGLWHLQDNVTSASGNRCRAPYGPMAPGYDLRDISYLHAVIAALGQHPERYDTTRLFAHGCSMGAAFSSYSSQCLHEAYAGALTAWSVTSTGMKSDGDGIVMPGDPAECAGCYFPFWPGDQPAMPALKACVFDNEDDAIPIASGLVKSSRELNRTWNELGNRATLYMYQTGGHCGIHSWEEIFECLDDGTGRLLGAGR